VIDPQHDRFIKKDRTVAATRGYMVIQGDLLRWCENKLADVRDELAALESGDVRTGKSVRGGPWQDTTQTEIARLQAQMGMIEALIHNGRPALRVVK
jgi:hypothetical protein